LFAVLLKIGDASIVNPTSEACPMLLCCHSWYMVTTKNAQLLNLRGNSVYTSFGCC